MKVKLVKGDVEYVVSDPDFIEALLDAGYVEVDKIVETEPLSEPLSEPLAELVEEDKKGK